MRAVACRRSRTISASGERPVLFDSCSVYAPGAAGVGIREDDSAAGRSEASDGGVQSLASTRVADPRARHRRSAPQGKQQQQQQL